MDNHQDMDTMEFLDIVWGKEDCWVDVPSKVGGNWLPWYCEWPADRPLVRSRIRSSTADGEDIYFSVARFSKRGRRIADVLPTHWLWADLDRVDPVFLGEDNVEPTMAWESSPGRYQCLWRLSRTLQPDKQSKLNRRLTRAIGADAGGYDLTQVLRPIETWNFKYKPAADVELIFYNEDRVYEPKEILAAIKEMEDDEKPPKVLAVTFDPRIRARARRLLATPPEQVVVGERSGRIWELSRELAKAGLSKAEAFDLIWQSAWNKWRDVATGETRLRADIKKAYDAVGKTREPTPKKRAKKKTPESPAITYLDMLEARLDAPRWLIEDIWTESSHGIIGGEPKTSKSTFALAMALSVASGKPFLGRPEFKVYTQGPAMMIQEENSPWWVQDRLRKLADLYDLLGKVTIHDAPKGSIAYQSVTVEWAPDVPLFFINNHGFNLELDEDQELVEREIKNKGIRFLVIDPLYLVVPNLNFSSNQEIVPILRWLTELHYNYDCATVIVHHWSKATEWTSKRRSGQRLYGSTFFHGWTESALYMERMEEENLRVRVEREFRNVEPQGALELMWDLGEPGESEGLHVSVGDYHKEDQVREIVERGLGLANGKGYNTADLVKELGWSNDTENRQKAAELGAEAGYTVFKVRTPKGPGYRIYREDEPVGPFSKTAKVWLRGGENGR